MLALAVCSAALLGMLQFMPIPHYRKVELMCGGLIAAAYVVALLRVHTTEQLFCSTPLLRSGEDVDFPSTAVCIWGMLRALNSTAPAILDKLVEPLGADLFVYAPATKGAEQLYAQNELLATLALAPCVSATKPTW